ncbi:hypothetical protein IWX50DRAFT_232609 [Phyllosticta citricarpa]
MTSDASSPRPRKRQRTSEEVKLFKDRVRVNGASEPPTPYVRRSSVSPVRPTPSDRTPIADAKTTIVSRRYRDKCGEPIYTVRIEYADEDEDNAVEEREVVMDDIEDYVSKAELERFELTWFDPDEVMPGIVIGAAGFERTQTWETPSSTGEEDGRRRSASTKVKKASTKASVDTLPPKKRRGRPAKKTAAIMGVGPAKNALDGTHGSEDEAYEFDADIEDEVNPANVRGAGTGTQIGGYVLIPSTSASVASSQRKAAAADQSHPKSLTPISSASASEDPEDFVSGFNPRRRQSRTAPPNSTTQSRGPGRPPKSAAKSVAAHSSIGSLLAYVESEEFMRDSNANERAKSAPASMPANPVEKGDEQAGPIARPQPAPLPETPPRRPVEIIEISSGSSEIDSEDSPAPTAGQRQDQAYEAAKARIVALNMAIDAARQDPSHVPPRPHTPAPQRSPSPVLPEPSHARDLPNSPPPRTPTLQRSPTPIVAGPSTIREARTLTLVPSLPAGATADTAICLDDDSDDGSDFPFDSNRKYQFSKVIDLKILDGKKYYLIQWNDDPCPPPDWSWYTEEDLGPHAYRMVENLIEEKLRCADRGPQFFPYCQLSISEPHFPSLHSLPRSCSKIFPFHFLLDGIHDSPGPDGSTLDADGIHFYQSGGLASSFRRFLTKKQAAFAFIFAVI